MRGGDVFCDICDKPIIGPCFFNEDHMMCRECDKIWEDQEMRPVSKYDISLGPLLFVFLCSVLIFLDLPAMVRGLTALVTVGVGAFCILSIYMYLSKGDSL